MLTPAVVAKVEAEIGEAIAVGVTLMGSGNQLTTPAVWVSPEWWSGEVCMTVPQALELAGALFTAIDRIAEEPC